MVAKAGWWQTGVGGVAASLVASVLAEVGAASLGRLLAEPTACQKGEDRLLYAGLHVPKGTLAKWFSTSSTIELLARVRPTALDATVSIEDSAFLDEACTSLRARAGRTSQWTLGEARNALRISLESVLAVDSAVRGQVELHRVDVGVDELRGDMADVGVEVFRGFGEASDKLDHIASILAGPSPADRERQVLLWNEQQFAMRSRLDGNRLRIATSLDERVGSLMTDAPWHERIRNQVTEVGVLASSLEGLSSLLHEMQSVDMDGGYDAIVQWLGPLSKSISAECGAAVRRLRATSGHDAEQLVEARRCAASAKVLADDIDLPTFGRALVVYGSWGSGRSRLLQTSIELALPRHDLCLAVGMSPGQTLEHAVIEQANSAFGDVQSLTDLNERLRDGVQGRCIVCFDDLHGWIGHQPRVLRSLLSLIQQTSNLHSLYWLATVDEGHLDAVGLGREESRALADYTRAARRTSRPDDAIERESDGMIAQDKVNAESKVGLKVIRQLAAGLSAEAAEDHENSLVEGTDESAALCNPRHAWLLSEAAPGSLDVTDLYLDSFVEMWWSSRLHDLTGSNRAADAYGALVEHLSQSFAAAGGPVGDLAIISALGRASRSRLFLGESDVRDAVDRLVDGGLLKEDHSNGEPSLRPHPTFPWGTPIGAALLADYKHTRDHSAIDRWLELAGRGDSLAEAVGRAFLVLLDRSGLLTRNLMRAEWAMWFERGGRATSAAWFAAKDATARMQGHMLPLAESSRTVAAPAPRELMAQISFLCHLDVASRVSLPRVLRLLQPNYQMVGDFGLGGYFCYALDRQLTQRGVTRDELVPLLLALAGAESAGRTHSAAALAAAATERLFARDWAAISQAIIEWATEAGTPKHSRLFPTADGGQQPFWSCYLKRICDHHAAAEGMNSLSRLRDLGWYTVGEPARTGSSGNLGRVADTMDKEANQSLASWYRTNRNPAYIEAVNKMSLSQDWNDLKTAYYLIRHSEPVNAGEAALVSPQFDPAWEPLLAAHHRKPIAPTLPGDAKVNLERKSAL